MTKRYHKITGVKVKSSDWSGRVAICEVLEADGERIRTRVTYEDGEVIENFYDPDSPSVPAYEWDGTEESALVAQVLEETLSKEIQTWRNSAKLGYPESNGYDATDFCLCRVLGHFFRDRFTGYEHNYKYQNGIAFHDVDYAPWPIKAVF